MAQERLVTPADLAARDTAQQQLAATLTANSNQATAEVRYATLRKACITAKDTLPNGSRAQLRLAAALQATAAESDAERAWSKLADEAEDLAELLAFRPLIQAGLAEGFPTFQALDELELREYPAYRMARVGMKGSANAAFWPLFKHIESNGIPMTTPVQIDWELPAVADARPRSTTMAFLYGTKSTGKPGRDGQVDVVDVPAMSVLSIGANGSDKESRIQELRDRMTAWLAAHASEWEVAGPLRTLAYNSPMVARDARYFEVQLPIQKVAKKKSGAV